jgi:hypothetical protein
MRRWLVVLAALGLAVGAASCILGPKQDDPAGASTGTDASNDDTGGGFKTDSGAVSDTRTPPPGDTGFNLDAVADTPAVPPDAAADAPAGDGDAAGDAADVEDAGGDTTTDDADDALGAD